MKQVLTGLRVNEEEREMGGTTRKSLPTYFSMSHSTSNVSTLVSAFKAASAASGWTPTRIKKSEKSTIDQWVGWFCKIFQFVLALLLPANDQKWFSLFLSRAWVGNFNRAKVKNIKV